MSMRHKISIKTYNNGVLSLSEFKDANLSNKEVVGIVIQTETIGVILALPEWEKIWGDNSICIDVQEGCYIGEATALTTLCGLEATKRIVEANKDSKKMFAAKRCLEYECAGLQWYLPSMYELGMIRAYKDEINDVLNELELPDAKLGDEYTWSSSEYTQTSAWGVYFSNGNFTYHYRYGSYVVRAVCAFEPLKDAFPTQSSKDCTNISYLSEEELLREFEKRGYRGRLIKTLEV